MTSAIPPQPGPSLALDVLRLVPHCTTCQQGEQVAAALRPALQAGQDVALSFRGVRGVSSSFVNGVFVSLLDTIPVAAMRQHLRVVDSSRGINTMIRDQVRNSNQKANTRIRDQVRNNNPRISTEIRDQAGSAATQQPDPAAA